MTRPTIRRWWWAAAGVVVAAAALQLLPFGADGTNPPIIREPAWDSPQTRALAREACFDCHSNETAWPAYARVAPVSWLVRHDVDEGRAVLNFSEWDRPQAEASEVSEEVVEGEMPPRAYAWMHGRARLSDADRQRLADGLARTMAGAGLGNTQR
jgi:hypothetical protein